MVRYIRNDELYHYQVKGAKWHRRRYQYEDGSYTPLGRIHYGIGEYKDKTVGEKLLDTPRAIKNTYATYGYGKYKAKVKTNPSETDKAFMKKADEAREKRLKEKQEKRANAEAAAQKRLDETKARAEEKNREAAEARKKIEDKEAENRKKYKEEADKKADERVENLKKSIKELGEDVDKRLRGKPEEPANGKEEAKSGRFEDFSNEELKRFTERTKLETEASKAIFESRMAKLGAGKEVIGSLMTYGKMGLDAFSMYKNVRSAIDEYNNMHVPSQMQRYANDLLADIDKEYSKGKIKDPEEAAKFKEDIWRRQQMIEAVGKVFSMTKADYSYNQNPKGGDGKKNNQQNGNQNQNNQPKNDGSNNQSKKDKKKNKQQNGNDDGGSNNQSNENNNQPKQNYNVNVYNFGNNQPKENKSKNTMTRTEVANAIEKIVRRETDSSTDALNKRVDRLTEMVMNSSNSKVSVSNAQMESFTKFMNDYLIDG